MKKCIDLYPLTIIRDPYDGKFSGVKPGGNKRVKNT